MKNLHLQIPKPCHENWQRMLPEAGGRHCLACQKTVVDFTVMTDTEIVSFFKAKPALVCGRFRKEQLAPQLVTSKPAANWKAYLLAFAATLALKSMMTDEAEAQVQTEQRQPKPETLIGKIAVEPLVNEAFTVTGKIKDEKTKESLPGVSIAIKGTNRGTTTNANGEFSLPEVKNGDVLVTSYIGYLTEERMVQFNPSLTIGLRPDTTTLAGEVMVTNYKSPVHKRILYRIKSWFQQ